MAQIEEHETLEEFRRRVRQVATPSELERERRRYVRGLRRAELREQPMPLEGDPSRRAMRRAGRDGRHTLGDGGVSRRPSLDGGRSL